MSNAEAISGSDRGRSVRDPVTGLFLAMRDAWLAVALNECMSGQSMLGRNPGRASSGASLMEPMITMLSAMADPAIVSRHRFADPGDEAAAHMLPGSRQHSVAVDFALPIGHAMMIAANRSVSYWLNLAQILANHQAKSIQALRAEGIEGSVAGAELVAVDDVRALLRELGDLTTREARLLQNEFGILAESIAQSFQPSDQSGPHRRRWRSKL
jgi:hypothetical protein